MTDWLKRALAAASAPPAAARAELRLGESELAIGSIEPALAARLSAAGLPLRRRDAVWTIEGLGDVALAEIARWLHRERICPHWRDETLAVVDAAGVEVGRIERAAVRALGIATVAVHLIGRAAGGGDWVQLRAATKSTDPGLWDTLMGGQVAAGETIADSLARETMEEAGLVIDDLCDIERCADITIRRPVAEGYMVEQIAVFRAVVPEGAIPQNRDGEVERFECLDEDTLRKRLGTGAFTLEATLVLGAELARRDEAGRAS